MTLEKENEAVVRKFFDAISKKDYSRVRECIHDDYLPRKKSLRAMKQAVLMTNYPIDDIGKLGPEPLIDRIIMLFDGYDNFNVAIERLIVRINDVWVAVRVTGKHSRMVLGVPPTNKSIDYRGFLTYKLKDGRIIENDVLFDWFAMLSQLGLFSKPGNQIGIEEYLKAINKIQNFISDE